MADGQLAVVAVDPIEIANSLASIRNELPTLVEAVCVLLLVVESIDTCPGLSASVSLLELMDGNRANRRNEIYDFIRGLNNAGVTTLLTSEAPEARRTPRGMVLSRLLPMPSSTSTVNRTTSARPGWGVERQPLPDATHSREFPRGGSVYQHVNLCYHHFPGQ